MIERLPHLSEYELDYGKGYKDPSADWVIRAAHDTYVQEIAKKVNELVQESNRVAKALSTSTSTGSTTEPKPSEVNDGK